MTAMRMLSGATIDLIDPDWRVIRLDDIGVALARLVRFSGQSPCPLSVARHSIAVALDAPSSLRLAALLHDAHEAFTGDVTRPMRAVLERVAGRFEQAAVAALVAAFRTIETQLDIAIARAVLFEAGVDAGRLDAEADALAQAMRCPDLRRADDGVLQRELATLWNVPVLLRDAAQAVGEEEWGRRWVAEVRAAALTRVFRWSDPA
jgi:hypothetical protein